MPDDTITLIALKREDARKVHRWIAANLDRSPFVVHFRRCLSEEVFISKPMAYVVLENAAALELCIWLHSASDAPDCVRKLRRDLSDKLGVECEDIHEGGPR